MSEAVRSSGPATFAVGRGSRWTLVDPAGEPFLSIGVVHANDTNLRYPYNLEHFRARYGGSRRRWLRDGLVPELRSWGFNTIGWTSEYVSGRGLGATADVGHSGELPADDLAHAGLPYTLSLRVAEIEAWNGHPAFRDPREPAFGDWCDHLARTTCRPDDPNLLGYFLVDAPAWTGHRSGARFEAGELADIAEAYYRTAVEAIRRHDPHHLVLGDRYGTQTGVPDAVLDAMAPHVDVLSAQTFPGLEPARIQAACEEIDRWQQRTGLPVLIADTGNWCPTPMNPERVGSARDQAERGEGYARLADAFAARDWCLGWHWCSWVENPLRGFGLKDPWDKPYDDLVSVVAETNRRLTAAHHSSERSPHAIARRR